MITLTYWEQAKQSKVRTYQLEFDLDSESQGAVDVSHRGEGLDAGAACCSAVNGKVDVLLLLLLLLLLVLARFILGAVLRGVEICLTDSSGGHREGRGAHIAGEKVVYT
jgi:hypothetical protein